MTQPCEPPASTDELDTITDDTIIAWLNRDQLSALETFRKKFKHEKSRQAALLYLLDHRAYIPATLTYRHNEIWKRISTWLSSVSVAIFIFALFSPYQEQIDVNWKTQTGFFIASILLFIAAFAILLFLREDDL